ncbi:MAG: FHIPEP family type III secretion protein, partial [Deltaproteobacteria bacterium]|nr:FHIPEP family type III secretion protein [Deltaproteobacteria bacterium]
MQLDAATLQFKKIEDGVFGSLSRFGNVILISAVCAVLAMMMIPLPPVILDFLLAINVVGALTLLLVAISISDSMKIATFPTLLLVATLFRLGLNIASTRLILTQGYAGHIIQTFGQFATAGNLLVGVLMFLILTIIQFIVIAKGSERVAEVAARFTLDALPGKQMSIDADLRAGLISQEEAKSLREGLHRESKMYGAMDGAMKFVKGDAIAGIIITVVNIFGGLVAGVLQRG